MPSRDYDAINFLSHAAAGPRKERVRKRAYTKPKSKARPYAELRAASAFSFLDSASLPEDLIDHAARHDLPAMALVDRNGVYGAPRFYAAAKKAGVRALVGSELVMPVGDRLTVLVANRTGYKNLCKLITAGAMNHPKGQAVYTWEIVEQFADGLHCLTRATGDALDRIGGIFKGRTHVELQRHRLREEEHRNHALVELARRMRLPLVATNGVRYARAEDKELHDVLTCIREGRNVDNAGRLLGINRERHIKSADEMCALFRDLPEAIDGAWSLANTLDFTLADLGYQFPDYPLPPGETNNSFLRKITWNSAKARLRPMTARAQAQLEKELNMIEKLDLAGYFLIVWDIVQFCNREKILVQGRGSAANSAVCYALGITAVDPVKMDLLFERFLSEERGEWPDIDLDLPSGDQREKVIQHVYKTYGGHGAAMTANVITYRDRSAAREVGKGLGFSLEQADKLSKCMSTWHFGEIREKIDALPEQLAVAGFDAEDLRVRHFMRLYLQIQNLPRHLGQHSGGMVLAKGRLDEVVPLEPAAMPGRVVIQWDKDDCADLGLIKVDLLGLGMLAAIEEALPLIRVNEGKEVDLAHLPAGDPLVYKMLNEADTIGMFQVESRAQMASLPRNKPECFYDIVVQVAIIRPGPIVGGMIKPFFDRRQKKVPVEYPHPCLEPILKRTLGVPLFQEQLLRIAMVAAGFTGGEAEELRRAMGFKRSMERMVEIEKRLRAGMTERGIDGPAQEQIVKSITSFALYGFPESHAASFALIAYASAYIKAHHPAAFYIALLNAWPMGFYHPATLIKDAQRHKVRMLPIDVNRSGWKCRWENGAVRLGMRFVKGLRAETAARIEAAQPFASVDDLARRCQLRDDQMTKLAYSGTLATFGLTRRGALWQGAKAARPAGELFDAIPSVDAARDVDDATELSSRVARRGILDRASLHPRVILSGERHVRQTGEKKPRESSPLSPPQPHRGGERVRVRGRARCEKRDGPDGARGTAPSSAGACPERSRRGTFSPHEGRRVSIQDSRETLPSRSLSPRQPYRRGERVRVRGAPAMNVIRSGCEGSPADGARLESSEEILRAHPPPAQDDTPVTRVPGMTHPLREMSVAEETLADYATMDLTTGPHLLEHYRDDLTREGILSAAQLKTVPNGSRVTTAGAVIVRQRPGTAKGFVFLTLEDETGLSQAIVHPNLFAEQRTTILTHSGLIVEGIVQNAEGQASVRAENFRPLEGVAEVYSHDFH